MVVRQRTVVAGIEVQVRGQKTLDRLFKRLGGHVLAVSDKDIEIEFPTVDEAEAFKAAAKARGAIFD